MYKFVTFLQNTKGDALTVGALAVIDRSTSERVAIYSDAGGTPIADNLGVPSTTTKGLIEFYVEDGVYHVDAFKDSAASQFSYRITDFPMVADLSGQVADVSQAVSDAQAAASDAADQVAAATVQAGLATTAKDEAEAAQAAAEATLTAVEQYRVSIAYPLYSGLAAYATPTAGQSAAVFGDAGTHTDPVVGGTVDNAGIYSYSASPAGWQRISNLESADAAASAAAAAAAAADTPNLYTVIGEDGHAVSSTTIGSTTPNTATQAAGTILLNTPSVVQQGTVSSVSVRLSASGTGKLLIVNTATSKVVRTLASVSPLLTGVNTFTIPKTTLGIYETIAYQSLTGGRVRRATGTGGATINDADWDGTDGDSVTITSAGAISYAIAYTLYPIAMGATLAQRVTNRRSRGAEGIDALFDVTMCFFDQPGDTQTNLVSPGINDISLTAAPSPQNVIKSGHGVVVRNGSIKTTSVARRTEVILCRVVATTTAGFILSGGSGASVGISTIDSSSGPLVGTVDTVHIAAGEGVHPVFKQANGAGCWELAAGGWMVIFREMAQSYTSSSGLGGRHDTTATRAAEIEIGFFGQSTLQFNDAQRTTIANALSRRLAEQGAYVFNRDCPEKVDGAVVFGDSTVGRGYLWEADASFTATTTAGLNQRVLTVTAVVAGSTPLIPMMTVTGPGIPPGTLILAQLSGTTGGIGTYEMSAAPSALLGAVGAGKTCYATHQGADYSQTLVMSGAGVTGDVRMRDFEPLELGFNHHQEAANSHLTHASMSYGLARARKMTTYNRKRRLCVVQMCVGGAYYCPAGTISTGPDVPLTTATFHPTVAANTVGLFSQLLKTIYRAQAAARNRGLAFKIDMLAICLGAAHADNALTAPNSTAIQGWYQDIYNALVTYTNMAPAKVQIFLTQEGTGQDLTRLGYIRTGQAAVVAANSAAGWVSYDDNIAIPGEPEYGGAPYGQNPGGDIHQNLYSDMMKAKWMHDNAGWV